MATIEQTISAAQELMTGDREASFKLALYAAAMSPMQALDKNGRQTRILAKYVNQPLPTNRTELVNELRAAKGNINGTHLAALYRIEAVYSQLEQYQDIPSGYEAQVVWREAVLSHLTGYGMGRKTVSFAALLMIPDTCELVPVDRHVLKRLGIGKESLTTYKQYMEVENQIKEERDHAGYSNLPLGIWHWYKWEEWRQLQGKSKSQAVESHADLSPRIY